MNNNIFHPTIGFCVSIDHYPGLRDLLTKRLQNYGDHFHFIRFLFKDIDFEKRQVKAEKFNHVNKTWEEGIFPFPSVVYMQSAEKQENIKKLESVIGPYVFNNFIFDKWEGYNLLKQNKELWIHLPYTELLQSKEQFLNFFNQFKDIILKPIFGYSSIGIYRIKLLENNNLEVFHDDGMNLERQEIKHLETFWSTFHYKFSPGAYIIQQSINTVKSQGNVTDIRLNMDKNCNGNWDMSLLLFRLSRNNSAFISKSIVAYTLDKFLKSPIYDKEKMGDIGDLVINLGLKIGNAFDQSGLHMADIGIDLGMDENGYLWIFEVNPLPFPIVGIVKDYSLNRPIDYALYLISNMS